MLIDIFYIDWLNEFVTTIIILYIMYIKKKINICKNETFKRLNDKILR